MKGTLLAGSACIVAYSFWTLLARSKIQALLSIYSMGYVGAPGIFSDILRSVQMLKREWGAESNGKLPHLFNP